MMIYDTELPAEARQKSAHIDADSIKLDERIETLTTEWSRNTAGQVRTV